MIHSTEELTQPEFPGFYKKIAAASNIKKNIRNALCRLPDQESKVF